MNNNVLLAGLSALFLAVCFSAHAQQPKKIARIGFLAPANPAGYQHNIAAFRQGLRELGYVEDQNLVIEYRWADGHFERLPDLAAELARLKVDLIVAAVTQASLAAKNATKTVPIVMIAVGNPVEAGLVTSLARPGANLTGTSAMNDETVGKQLELLKETFPNISRFAALWNPANSVFQNQQMRATEASAKALNVPLQKYEARDPAEIERAFAAMAKEGAKALVLLSDPVFITHRKRIADLALKHRLPVAAGNKEFAEAGVLMSYGVSFTDLYRRSATYVDKILKGAKPADLPIERPVKFEFAINLNTAKQIGVTVPHSVLFRADMVIN